MAASLNSLCHKVEVDLCEIWYKIERKYRYDIWGVKDAFRPSIAMVFYRILNICEYSTFIYNKLGLNISDESLWEIMSHMCTVWKL